MSGWQRRPQVNREHCQSTQANSKTVNSRWQCLSTSIFALLIVLASPTRVSSQPVVSQSPGSGPLACGLFEEPQHFNTQTNSEGVISIGKQPGRPYRLIMTSVRGNELRSLRACIPDAFETRSSAGSYVLVGSFDRRRDVEHIHRTLRRAGYPTRVIYLR